MSRRGKEYLETAQSLLRAARAARSRLCAVSRYSFPRRDICMVIGASRGFLKTCRQPTEIDRTSRAHPAGASPNVRRTFSSKGAFAKSSSGPGQTCRRTRHSERFDFQKLGNSLALSSPLVVASDVSITFSVASRQPHRLSSTKSRGTNRNAASEPKLGVLREHIFQQRVRYCP